MYTQSGYPYGFPVNVDYNKAKGYVVYFDTSSNFTIHSSFISGHDNISETAYAPSSIDVIQYRSMSRVSAMNYSSIRAEMNFNISVSYGNGTLFWSYGERVPERKNIFSSESPVLFQDSKGFVNDGWLTVNVW